jgi:hypothetical protein
VQRGFRGAEPDLAFLWVRRRPEEREGREWKSRQPFQLERVEIDLDRHPHRPDPQARSGPRHLLGDLDLILAVAQRLDVHRQTMKVRL